MPQTEEKGSSVAPFFVGGFIGAAIGLLFAPLTGRETRGRIGRWMEDMEHLGKDMARDGLEGARRATDDARR